MSLELIMLVIILAVAVMVLLPDHPSTDWEVEGVDPSAPDGAQAADTASQSDDRSNGDAGGGTPSA